MTEKGRLLIDGSASGSWNMAVDQAILEHASESARTTLRFYQWTPATLSLGYFQPIADRQDHPPSQACPLVRRATGGGAIIHDRELTYSLCVSRGTSWSTDHRRLYDLVHNALIKCLSQFGINGRIVAQTQRRRPEPFLCFQRRTAGDVTLNGEKICGSAQRRIEKSILQHGSILWETSRCAPELPGISELSSESIGPKQLSELLVDEIQSAMDILFETAELSDSERNRSREIESTKFDSDRWNAKR